MLKKLIILTIGMCALFFGSVALAMEAQYTDIAAYINHYPIPAYAVNGKMAVVAEDLRDYGFNVDWDGNARTLTISRNIWTTELVRKDVYKHSKPTGSKFSDIYPTDIKVYCNGVQVESYALNGYTMIPVNDLADLIGTSTWDESTRSFKVWVDGLSICDYRPLTERCINLFYENRFDFMPVFEYSNDMDSDGIDDKIYVQSYSYDYDYLKCNVKVGNSSTYNIVPFDDTYAVCAIYLVDLVPDDHAKEIVFFFNGTSDDPYVVITRYSNGGLELVEFSIWDEWESAYRLINYLNTGYVSSYPFTVNDDGSFTLRLMTPSYGMWDVYQTFYLTDEGSYVCREQDYYDVADEEQDYTYVKKTLTGRGLPLNEGDYIKILYDDGKNNIYIVKKDGTGGWFDCSYDYDGDSYMYLGDYCDIFHLAG